MISDNSDWMGGASKVLLPLVQSQDDSKEFLVINIIVSFSWCKGFGEVSAGVMVSIVISLQKYSSSSEEGGVCHNGEGTGDIRDYEDWGGGEYLFEHVNGILL